MSSPSERHKVFAAITAALSGSGPAQGGTPPPTGQPNLCVSAQRLQAGSLWENFAANFRAVNGRPLRATAELAAFLLEHRYQRGFCDPALREEVGSALERQGLEVLYSFSRERVDDYLFGITRASGAIAESGSLILDDNHTADRLAALAPWVHVAVLREADLVRTIPEAVARLGSCPHVVWVTGPSKTADIEGILIEGVHGPGVQICLCPET